MILRQLPARPVRRADDGPVRPALPRRRRRARTTSGTYALHTLSDDETIARLATGIKRFKVPDEFNWIKIYERVAGRGKSTWGEQARDALANEFEDRRQYVKAAAAWKQGHRGVRPRPRQLPPAAPRPDRRQLGPLRAGRGPAGRHQGHRRFPLPQRQQGHLRGPRHQRGQAARRREGLPQEQPRQQLDWNKINIGNIGYRLVEQQRTQYLGDKVAALGHGPQAAAQPRR